MTAAASAALTLGYLEKIEQILRDKHNNRNLKLCEYFDLIGGTSTGSIIAAALAIGMDVAEVKKMYLELGEKVFTRNNPLKWLKAFFSANNLRAELEKTFKDITLGGSEIKTGLAVFAKRADTGSTWVFINHPEAMYYPDNKDILLRRAVRPWSTVLIFADGERLPFDVGLLRALPYKLSGGLPSNAESDQNSLTEKLKEAIKAADENVDSFTDSPIFQLVENFPDIQHLKTDVFRDRVNYSNEIKELLAVARRKGLDAVREVETNLANLKTLESAAIVDLFLSYRAVKGWQEMIDLAEKMPKPLAATVMVQEQLAMALNRAGKGEEAERVLLKLLENRGASSETYGILGRVYKDRWEQAEKDGKKILAKGLLEKAIDAYLKGFEADFRDAYPGINAVTLMELKEPPDPRREKILPVVQYAVEQRVAKGTPDYWDYATLLELAVLAKDEEQAIDYTAKALSEVREVWEPETTMRNLRLIREAREKRGENTDWIKEIEEALAEKTKIV